MKESIERNTLILTRFNKQKLNTIYSNLDTASSTNLLPKNDLIKKGYNPKLLEEKIFFRFLLILMVIYGYIHTKFKR